MFYADEFNRILYKSYKETVTFIIKTNRLNISVKDAFPKDSQLGEFARRQFTKQN